MDNIDEFEALLDREYDENVRMMMKHLSQQQSDINSNIKALKHAVFTGTVDRMILHFENCEEYEYCGILVQLKNKVMRGIN